MSVMRPSLLVALATLLLPTSLGAVDRGADGKFDQRSSIHFRLFQDVDIDRKTGLGGSRHFEQAVLDTLEDAFRQVEKKLDIRPRSDIKVVIYDPGVFDGEYSALFRFRAAGFYDGTIHVRGGVKIDRRLVRTLHHEYFHAAFDAVAARQTAPAWLNEGLAEWFENLSIGKRHLSTSEHGYLSRANRLDHWIPMAALSEGSFAGLEGNTATLAYLQSYALVEHMMRVYGQHRMRRFMRQFLRGANLEWLLKREFRVSLRELEANLRAEL